MMKEKGRAVNSRLAHPISISLVLALAGTLALAGCSPSEPAGLTALRNEFVSYGGVCDSWTAITEPRSLGAITCNGGAELFLFDSDSSRSDVVKDQLETNTAIRARTHIMLSGDYWLVIDKIPVIIHLLGRMGGMIQGRNGANP